MHSKQHSNNNRSVARPRSDQPPQRIQSLNVTQTVRFATASGALVSADWLQNEIMDQWFVATAATVGYRLCDAVRIRKIEIWAPANSSTPTTLASIEESPGIYLAGPNRIIQDMVVGTARAAHVVWTPRPNTAQAFFLTSGTASNTPLFRFTVPPYSVVDITYSLVIADGSVGPTLVVGAIAGASVGNVYCRQLCRNGSTACAPVSISTN
jgi:hypothetical protein